MIRFRTLCAVLVMAALCASASRPLVERWRFEQREDARLHAHFARVLAELSQRDVSGLDAAQRTTRARLLSLLRDYDRRGCFPRNEGQRPGPTPIFVDRHGTRCAMAYLIEHAGGPTLVARIAAVANLARIPELAGDGELGGWLNGAGLDLAEAARIQPEYPNPPGPPKVGPRLGSLRGGQIPDNEFMRSTSVLSVALGIPAIALNLAPARSWRERRQTAGFAVLVGAGSIGMGVVGGLRDGRLGGPANTELTIGACALTLGLLEQHHQPRSEPIARIATPEHARTALAVRAGQEGEPQVGFRVSF